MPKNFLQLAVLASEHKDEAYVIGAPIFLQQALLNTLGLLAPVGRSLGYRARYPVYSGEEESSEGEEATQQGASDTRVGTVVAAAGLAILVAFLVLRWRRRSSSRHAGSQA